MTLADLLREVAARQSEGVSTTKVTMSPKEARELRISITKKRRIRGWLTSLGREPRYFGEVFFVQIYQDKDVTTPIFEEEA